MATKASRTEHHERSGRRLRDQPLRFVGLYLASIPGLFTAWLIHAYVQGVQLDWGPIHWHVDAPDSAPVIASVLLTLVSVGLSVQAYGFAEHRKVWLQRSLAGSVFGLGMLFAINVGTGPHYWWSGIFVITGWIVALLWSLARLDVTRSDPRGEDTTEKETFLDKIGLKGYRGKVTETVMDDDGTPLRSEIKMTHAPGGTIDPVQSAVPNMESYVGAPAGLSRAVPSGRADQSHVTLLHKDPLAGRIPLGPPSHPGGSIKDPLTFAIYDDGHPVWCYLGGGPGFSPSGYGFMGMSRTGKTWAENQMLSEVITRRDTVIMYLNRAKGMQDVRMIIDGIEVAIISDSVGDYVSALNRVKRIMTYRSNQLGLYGITEWDPQTCFWNPPQRRADGQPIPMEPMPALIVHVGEADAVLEQAGDLGVYLSSKGLSLGVIPGYSLQRASAESMPTGLRFNVGTWWCFGCGDEVSVGFALSEPTIRAGAHPEYWKQSKPGNFYFEGVGIDDTLFAKRAKTQSGDSDAAFKAEMLARNAHFGPLMAKLDQGSVNATRAKDEPEAWWTLHVRNTDAIRRQLTGGTANLTESDRRPQTADPNVAAYEPPANQTAPEDDMARRFAADAPQSDETAEHVAALAEVEEEIRALREEGQIHGVELYPVDEFGDTAEREDPRAPLPDAPADDDLEWEDDRPEPSSRGDMILAVHEVLRQLMADPAFHDPSDPTGNTIIVQMADIKDRMKYRSRSWFSTLVSEMAKGLTTPPPAMTLERTDDGRRGRPAVYRVRQLPPDDPANNV